MYRDMVRPEMIARLDSHRVGSNVKLKSTTQLGTHVSSPRAYNALHMLNIESTPRRHASGERECCLVRAYAVRTHARNNLELSSKQLMCGFRFIIHDLLFNFQCFTPPMRVDIFMFSISMLFSTRAIDCSNEPSDAAGPPINEGVAVAEK